MSPDPVRVDGRRFEPRDEPRARSVREGELALVPPVLASHQDPTRAVRVLRPRGHEELSALPGAGRSRGQARAAPPVEPADAVLRDARDGLAVPLLGPQPAHEATDAPRERAEAL